MTDDQLPPHCPECGEVGVPLLFGLPVPEASEAAAAGDLALGGCLRPEPAPNWECPLGHQWTDPDEQEWDRRLLTALTAHGYVDIEDDAV